ncbi:MAG: hypothetical protein KY475_17065 [Planctomycetes bacterium]|nr:hypothetical protein [Planctomycetota bacterium]
MHEQFLDVTDRAEADRRFHAALLDLAPLVVLRDTNVSHLAPLAGISGLEGLDLSGTPVTDLSPLSGMTRMQYLWLIDTRVTNLAPLTGMTTATIYMDNSQPVSIPVELQERVCVIGQTSEADDTR